MHRNKYIAILLLFITLFCTTGCSASVPATATIGVESAFTERINANIDIANKLYSSGLISTTERDTIVKSINDQYSSIAGSLADVKTLNVLLHAIVDYTCVPDNSTTNPEGGNISDRYITNYMTANGKINAKEFKLITTGAQISPIKLIDDASANIINGKLQYPIYVINENVSLDQLNQALKEATSGTEIDNAKISPYFHELKDPTTKKTVTLLDSTDVKNFLVQPSTGSTLVNTTYDAKSNIFTNTVTNTDTAIGSNSSGLKCGDAYSNNMPGTDMALVQNSQRVMALRFSEFNQAAYDKIVETLGLCTDEYLVATSKDFGNRVYLLQYPVGYIKGFKLNTVGDSYESIISKSELQINLKTGKLFKVNNSTGDKGEVDMTDSYISLGNGTPDTSSFIIDGKTGLSSNKDADAWDLEFGANKVKASIARIVLRDYLELSYSPNIYKDYKITSYGRKFRIDKLTGKVIDPVGWYCGADGIKPDSPRLMYVNEFCDIQSAIRDRPYIKSLPGTGSEVPQTPDKEKELQTKIDNLSEYQIEKTDELEKITSNQIESTTSFPGSLIDIEDYSMTDTKPMFYGMIVGTNFSTSGLMPWIIADSDTNSTKWWNGWLSNHKFLYTIDSDVLSGYLKNNYTFELNKEGIIILDLETIAKIQSEYNENDNLNRTHTLRTFFKILGYILVCYSVILVACWTLDTNVDLGFGLLQKVSFGHLIAVTSEDEFPESQGVKGVAYVDFSSVCVVSVRIMLLGIILIFIDIVSLVLLLIKSFGNVAKYIGSFIGG